MTVDCRPTLSIVIAATDSPSAVDRALRALDGQGSGWVEIIVVAEARRQPIAEGIIRVEAPAGSGVARLRWLGLEVARGRVVAFTEDSCLAETGWAVAWLSAFDDPTLVAASGLVEHAVDAPWLDRAVVLCEYAPFLPPARPGPPTRLAGNNFAVLAEFARGGSAVEVHETTLLGQVRRSGEAFRMVEAARVRHVRRFGPVEAFADRLRFGLEFGRLRCVESSNVVRWAGLVAGPAIFAAQAGRLARTVRLDRRHLGRFLGCLPITMALLACWSLGEWLGWSLGPPTRARPPARRRRGIAGRSPGPGPGRVGSPRSGYTPTPPVA